MLPSARHLDQLVGPIGKFVLDVVDQGVEIAGAANHARRGFAINRRWRGKDHHLDAKDVAGKPVITKARLLTGGSVSIAEAHAALVHALSDPTYRKEVVMLTSGLLGARASTAFTRRNNQDLQFLYFLASARTSFDRAGVRYRIVCNP